MVELTEREREVAELVGRNMTYPEIGDALDISPRTVEAHVTNIARKLGNNLPTPKSTVYVYQAIQAQDATTG